MRSTFARTAAIPLAMAMTWAGFTGGALAQDRKPITDPQQGTENSQSLARGELHAQSATPISIPEQGVFETVNIRTWSEDDVIGAPIRASNDRMALIVYGDGVNARAAATKSGQDFAKYMKKDVTYLWAEDNDANPNNTRIGVYANGRHKFDIDVGTARTPREIYKDIVGKMKAAYAAEFNPSIALNPRKNDGPG